MKYKHIFWDWNGTLFNDTKLCHEITNALLEEIGIKPISFDYYRKTLRHPIKEFYDEITNSDCSESYAAFSEKFHEAYEKKRYTCRLHESADSCIDFFKSHETTQSILSAHPQYLLDGIITHLNISHHFNYIIGSSDKLAANKFSEAKKLAELCSASPQEILILGDTTHDAEIAEFLGADCVIISQGMQCGTRLTGLKFPVISSLNELTNILK